MPLAYLSSLAAGPCPSRRTKERSWRRHVPRPKHRITGDHLRRYSGAHQSESTDSFWFYRLMGDWLVIILWKQQDRNRLSSYKEKKKNAWAVFSLLPPVDGISIEASKNHVGRACASNFLSLLAISVMQVCILLLAISVMLLQVSTLITHWRMWLCLLMPADQEAAAGHVVNVTTTWSGRRQPSRSNLQARSVASAARATASGVEMCSTS